MRHVHVLILIGVLIVSLPAAAQPLRAVETTHAVAPVGTTARAASRATTAQYRIPDADASACPVGFSVTRRSSTDLLTATTAARRPDAQVIDVVLQPSPDRLVRSAAILVHAYAGGPMLLPIGRSAGESPSRPSIVDRSFLLEAKTDNDLRQSVVLNRVSGIASVDLVALHFEDGSSWHAYDGDPCRAVPSLYLAVGAR